MRQDNSRILAGAMSGTSADGVDVALVRVSGRGLDMRCELLAHHHRAYPADLRAKVFSLRDDAKTVSKNVLAQLAQIGREISLCYALGVNEALVAANMSSNDLAAIAAHGQTLYHDPPDSIQWLDPALLAAEVGCAVVSDFRRADLAAGGQGAPLVPFADYILFRHPTKHRVVINIGGIANLTFIEAGAEMEDVIAFDIGPGNCISDHLMREHDPNGPGYDEGGKLTAQSTGEFGEIVRLVLSAAYFSKMPPKSTDGPEMIALFEQARKETGPMPLPDLLRAACVITATSIANTIKQLPHPPAEILISGGGTRNRTLMNLVEKAIDQNVLATDEQGVRGDAKEALAFALLAAATLDGLPSNVPSATGARRAVVLGSITPKP
jgi:anhydro-N-acetylmuramic acid kinase